MRKLQRNRCLHWREYKEYQHILMTRRVNISTDSKFRLVWISRVEFLPLPIQIHCSFLF